MKPEKIMNYSFYYRLSSFKFTNILAKLTDKEVTG
jgi:hypothetical protein